MERGRRVRAGIGAAGVLLAVAACSSGGSGGSLPSGSATGSVAAAASAAAASPGIGPGGVGGLGPLLAGGGLPQVSATLSPDPATPTGFSAPSKNIACALSADNVRCDIGTKQWTPPPKPASCPNDWGNGLEVGTGTGEVVCAGDAVPQGTVLEYEHAITLGPFTCVSQTVGVTCVNTQTEHGFFIARETYRVF